MQNLAGHKDADPIVESELFIAGVEIVRASEPQDGEVRTRISGRLGTLVFTRAWYYWCVEGDVPLEIARKIYAQEPYGSRDVRIDGHCGCVPPEDPWVEYRDASGKRVAVLEADDRRLFGRCDAGELDVHLTRIITELRQNTIYVDTVEERTRIATSAFVTSYHIDSQAGLKVFVDAMMGRL